MTFDSARTKYLVQTFNLVLFAAENLPVTLKWPNDIVHKGRKLGGILTESRLGSGPTKVVLGIGLNIGQVVTDFPDQLAQAATSVHMIGGRNIGTEQLLANILFELETIALQDFREVTSSWMNYCAHKDSAVTFHHGDELVTGTFIGLTDQGQALIESAMGERTISAGDLIIVEDDKI